MTFSVMADVPNPLFDSNGDPFSGAVLKAFLPGTTTNISIAIDSTGSSPQATITYNAEGKLEVTGNEILPYIDRTHKWGIFANAADATANTPFYMGPFNNVEKTSTSSEFSKSFDTVSLMVADTTLAIGEIVETAGYLTKGDGGDNRYEVVAAATGTNDAFEFINLPNTTPALQAKALFPGGVANIKQAGAFGDGSTDDQAFIAAAIATGRDIFYPAATYKLASTVDWNISAKHYGLDRKTTKILMADNLTLTVTAADVTLEGINFSAGGLSVDVHLLKIEKGANNFTMDACRIGDTATLVATSTQNGLRIDAQDVAQFEIKNTLFENISCMGDLTDIPVFNGFASGVIFFGNEAAEIDYTAPSKGSIHDCDFVNIFTEKNPENPGTVDSDADAVRIVITGGITPATNVQWGLDIDDCYFKSVQKSAVKCGGMTNLNVRRATIISDRTDIPMIAAVRIQWGSNVSVEDITCVGSFTFLINLFGQNIDVRGVSYSPTDTTQIDNYCILIQTETAFENRGITVTDVRATKCLGAISLSDPASVGSTGTNMSFSNFYIDRLLASSSVNPVLDIKDCTDVRLEDINIYDSNAQADVCLFLRDYEGLVIDSCYFEARLQIINQDDNSTKYPNLDLNNTVCKWVGSGNITVPLVNFVPTSGTEQVLHGIRIDGLTIISRSTTARVENGLKIKADDFSLDNIKFFGPDTVPAVIAPFIEALEVLDSSKGSVNAIRYNTDIPVAGAGTSWAVNIENSDGITVSDIVSDNNGVILRGTSTSNLINGVNCAVGEIAVQDDSSGTNTTANLFALVTP